MEQENSRKSKIISVIKLIIKIALILMGLYIFYIYAGPLVSLGVINAGNLFGFGVAGVLIFTAVFLDKILQAFQTSRGRAIISVICALLVIFSAVFFATLSQVVKHSKYTADNESTVIVLGCQIRGSIPSMTLKARCNAAADYMKEHPDSVAIATGGQGADEDLSEGQCIFNLMTENGIDKSRIYIEDKSTNTDQNVANAKIIIDENGFSSDVAVATSEYHQYRASMICKKNGLTASSIPSRSSRRAKPTFFTREVFAVWAQWLKR